MAQKTAAQLKEQFAAGKYPTAADYADLIDSITSGGGATVWAGVDGDPIYSGHESTPPAANSLVIVTNNGSTAITVSYSYSNNSTVTIAPNGAVTFLATSQSDEFLLIGTPIPAGANS